MTEKFRPGETKNPFIKPVRKDEEKTPRMVGAPKHKRTDASSESLSRAVLEHIGDEPKGYYESVDELRNEVGEEVAEFLPDKTVETAGSTEGAADEMESFDIRLSIPPEAPPAKETAADKAGRPETPDIKFGLPPDEETIARVVLKEIQRRDDVETKGFTFAGDRIRVVLADDQTDPERIERLTRLGLSMIKMAEKRRSDKNKK